MKNEQEKLKELKYKIKSGCATETDFEKILPQKTSYQYMVDSNTDGNKLALSFPYDINGKLRKNTMNYDEFKNKISEYAKGFLALGLIEDDRVLMLMPNIPETTCISYGLMKIGAIPVNIDPTSPASKVEKYLEEHNVKTIVCFESLYKASLQPIEEKLKEKYNINQIIVHYLKDSLLFPESFLMNLKKINEKKENHQVAIISTKDLLKNSRFQTGYTMPYIPNKVCAIGHSSGTTGFPKIEPTTNEVMNFMVMQHKLTDIDFSKINTFLHILPAFAQFGFTNSMHLGHCLGFEMIEVPIFQISEFPDLLIKYHPNCVYGMPSWWLTLIENPKYQNIDLSFLYEAISGGDSLTSEQTRKINDFLDKHNAHCHLRVGYGLSEFSGSCIVVDPYHTPEGSCGKVMFGGEGKIISPETKKELPYNQTGMLCFRKPFMIPQYYDGKKIYESINLEGKNYLITGDYLSKTEDNDYYFQSRESGMIARADGYKIYPKKVENAIASHKDIKDCMISSYYDESMHGNIPFAHITLEQSKTNEEIKQIIEELISNTFLSSELVNFREIPRKWLIMDELIKTSSLKKDYETMKQIGLTGEEITVEIDETNLGVDYFNVKLPTNSKRKLNL